MTKIKGAFENNQFQLGRKKFRDLSPFSDGREAAIFIISQDMRQIPLQKLKKYKEGLRNSEEGGIDLWMKADFQCNY